MEILEKDGAVQARIEDALNLDHIFRCGQCFRWRPSEKGGYVGAAYGRAARVWQRENVLFLRCSMEDFDQVWRRYFDLGRRYDQLTQGFCLNEFMEKAVAHGRGLRILRQQPWEALISFIVSQCNNIPRISGILQTMCRLWGRPLELEGEELYAFPEPEILAALSLEDLAVLRAGYRAKYILAAAQAVCQGKLNFDALEAMDADQARQALTALPGVGRKVADCVLLYGLGKMEAFPVDAWMKKAAPFYGANPEDFGPSAGIAQQYIFYYVRESARAESASADRQTTKLSAAAALGDGANGPLRPRRRRRRAPTGRLRG